MWRVDGETEQPINRNRRCREDKEEVSGKRRSTDSRGGEGRNEVEGNNKKLGKHNYETEKL